MARGNGNNKGFLSPQAQRSKKQTVRSHEKVVQPRKKGGRHQLKGKMTAAEFKRGVVAVSGKVSNPQAVIGAASWGVTKKGKRGKKGKKR